MLRIPNHSAELGACSMVDQFHSLKNPSEDTSTPFFKRTERRWSHLKRSNNASAPTWSYAARLNIKQKITTVRLSSLVEVKRKLSDGAMRAI